MKILMVGPGDSPHLLNAINNIKKIYNNCEFFFYSSAPFKTLKDIEIPCKILDVSRSYLHPSMYWPLAYECKSLPYSGNVDFLHEKILEINPDVIHFFCFQDAGYLVGEALNRVASKNMKIVGTCFGNDLYYFRSIHQHSVRIKSVLSKLDLLLTDNYRDFAIARKLGYLGEIVHIPLSSTIMKSQLVSKFESYAHNANIQPSLRSEIVVKGGNIKRSRNTQFLILLDKYIDSLGITKVNMVSFEQEDLHILHDLIKKRPSVFSISGFTSHKYLCEMLSKSKLAVSLNMSDGVPHFFIEACYYGAYPIFSKHTALGIYEEQGLFSLIDPNDRLDIIDVLNLLSEDIDSINNAAKVNLSLLDLLDDQIIERTISKIYV